MAAEYGSSMQATRPNIGKKSLGKHGMSDSTYLHPEYQPVALHRCLWPISDYKNVNWGQMSLIRAVVHKDRI